MQRTEKTIALIVWFLTLTSCGTSHKTMTTATEISRDSVTVSKDSVMEQHKVTQYDFSTASVQEQYRSSTASEDSHTAETVTEDITETTDSAGRRTVTTHRTVNRSGKHSSTAASEDFTRMQLHELRSMMRSVDSLMYVTSLLTATDYQYRDSMSAESEKTGTVSGTLRGWLFDLGIFIVLLVIIKWLLSGLWQKTK